MPVTHTLELFEEIVKRQEERSCFTQMRKEWLQACTVTTGPAAIPREQTCIPLDPATVSIAKINISKLLFAGMLVLAIKQ